MVGVVIGRRAATRTSLASAVLGVAVFAPRTRRIGMRTVVRDTVSAGVARHRPAVLTGGIVAPASVAQAVRSIVIAGCATVSAVAFPTVLAAGIFLPASIGIAVAGCVDGLALALTAIAAIFPVAVSRTRCVLLIVQHPGVTAAVRAGPRTIRTRTVVFIHISAEIFCVMAE